MLFGLYQRILQTEEDFWLARENIWGDKKPEQFIV